MIINTEERYYELREKLEAQLETTGLTIKFIPFAELKDPDATCESWERLLEFIKTLPVIKEPVKS
jgi:hypothetical protein